MDQHETRIAPLTPPYPEGVAAALQRMMPPGAPIEPLALFRVLAHNPAMADAMQPLGRFFLGRRAPGDARPTARDREIVIARVSARCGCEYEWGVHVVAFGGRVGLTETQFAATVASDHTDPCWDARDALLVRLVDELHDHAKVSDALWSEAALRWSPPELLELLLLAGWYHAIAFVANGARIACEPWAARFPG